MPKCPICYDFPFEGERCPICGFSANPQEAVWWKVVAYHPLTGRRLEPRPFSKREYAKIHVERLKALGYEARYFPAPYGRDPPEAIAHANITWDYVAGFVDGEAHISATIRDRRLITYFEIYQRNHERGAVELLEKIGDFLRSELGVEGTIYERAPNDYVLYYRRDLDVYKICRSILPYLRLKHRIEQAKETMKTIEEFIKTQINRMKEYIEAGKDLVAWAHLREYQEWLREIEEAKKRYPSTLT